MFDPSEGQTVILTTILVIAELRERFSVTKQVNQIVDIDRFIVTN